MKLAIGLPWYAGADENTEPFYLDLMMYFGALRERTLTRDTLGVGVFNNLLQKLPPLDESQQGGPGEPTQEEWEKLGRLEINLINRTRISLPGKARELIVEDALGWGADWLITWDADMWFDYSAFLQLWRNQKMVCGALAFTARQPVHPVLYRMRTHYDKVQGFEVVDGSDIVLDYPRDQLISSEQIGGELAFGAGVVLYNMDVFRELPQPWFNSTGCGEDWFFCHRCSKYNIPRFVDTRVKSSHKVHDALWSNEESYWNTREISRASYIDLFGEGVTVVKEGEVVIR